MQDGVRRHAPGVQSRLGRRSTRRGLVVTVHYNVVSLTQYVCNAYVYKQAGIVHRENIDSISTCS